jgi:hypothetical protein
MFSCVADQQQADSNLSISINYEIKYFEYIFLVAYFAIF